MADYDWDAAIDCDHMNADVNVIEGTRSMTVMAHPECKTCGGYGEMEPWSDNDAVHCTNPHCVMGCDTSKPKEPVSDKIAKAVEQARGYDAPPEFSVVFSDPTPKEE